MEEKQRGIPWFSVVFVLFFSLNVHGNLPYLNGDDEQVVQPVSQEEFVRNAHALAAYNYDSLHVEKKAKHTKANAVLLAVALGPFGVHRLYLGTEAKVPVIYTLTLGGGLGILPLIDIIAILSTPSLELYEDNSKVIMWAK